MSYIDAAILGLVQGLTEFLPVSSSGHLVLCAQLLGTAAEENLLFDVLVHCGTLGAVIVVFRERILALLRAVVGRGPAEDRLLAEFVVIGTVPAAVIGLAFEGLFEQLFSSLVGVSLALLVTGTILRFAKERSTTTGRLRLGSAMTIGCAQALAIAPGISRSGTTIVVALRLGLSPEKAAEYSFLLAIPAIGGAFLLKLKQALEAGGVSNWGPHLLGTALAAVSGWVALRWLLALLRGGRFHHFSWYCWAVGGVSLVLAWTGHTA